MIKKLLALLLLTASATVSAATFQLFQPSNGILVGNANTFVTTAATSTNVLALWTGTCSSAAFLRGDGACSFQLSGAAQTFTIHDSAAVADRLRVVADGGVLIGAPTGGSQGPGSINAASLFINGAPVGTSTGAVSSVALAMPSVFSVSGSPVTSAGTLTAAFATGQTQNQVLATPNGSSGAVGLRSLVSADLPALGANPTGTIGLTAVNGSATTYVRSDGAPALSQAILPTWTGAHRWSSTTPALNFTETDQGADGQNWITRTQNGTYSIATATDAAPTSVVNSGLQITRSGTQIPSLNLNATTVTLNATTVSLDGATVGTGQIQGTSSGAATGNASFYSNANAPFFRWREADQAVDARDWLFGSSAGVMQLGAVSDAGTSPPNGGLALQATRTGSTVTGLSFGNNTANPSFTWVGSGNWSVGGSVGTSGQVLKTNGAGLAPTWQDAGVSGVGLSMPSGFSVSGSPVTSSGTLTVTTSLNGPLAGNGSGFTTATAANIYGLWSGTCSASTFLRGDGSCQTTGSVPGGASTQVQYNNAGVFGADSDFTWESADRRLNIGFTGDGVIRAAPVSSGGGRSLFVSGGSSTAASQNGGSLNLSSGTPGSGGNGGNITLTAQNGTSGGDIALVAGLASGGTAGDITLNAGGGPRVSVTDTTVDLTATNVLANGNRIARTVLCSVSVTGSLGTNVFGNCGTTSRQSTGRFTIDYTNFSTMALCVGSVLNSAAAGIVMVDSVSTLQVTYSTRDAAGTLSDFDVIIQCSGY